jgi:DNA-binding GntR family transcriptional regulator
MSKKYEAYEKVKSLILNHQLSPGQKLIYRDLEEKIGMTKTPIINGLIMLEKEGFVVAKKNRGFYCSEINSGEAKQIFDLREKLENLAIEYAVGNYIKEDLEILKRKLKEYDAYPSLIYDNKRLFLDTGHLRSKWGKIVPTNLKQFYASFRCSILKIKVPCL